MVKQDTILSCQTNYVILFHSLNWAKKSSLLVFNLYVFLFLFLS